MVRYPSIKIEVNVKFGRILLQYSKEKLKPLLHYAFHYVVFAMKPNSNEMNIQRK